jgi:hypothetical protein
MYTRTEEENKSWDFCKIKAKASFTTVAVNTTDVQPTTPAPPAPLPPAPTPHTVMTNATDICHVLSNNTSWDSFAAPSHVVIDGRTYTISHCDCTYFIHHNPLRPFGSLIDGGANGGLSGSDVVVIAETLLTADVTGIAHNALQ